MDRIDSLKSGTRETPGSAFFMKTPQVCRPGAIPLVAAISGLMSVSSQAVLLVHESFSGYTNGNLSGQNTLGTGFTGAWEFGQATLHQVSGSGLTFSGIASSGGSLSLGTGTRLTGATLSLSSNLAAGATLYTSSLINFSAYGTGDAGMVTRINPSSRTAASGYFGNFADSRASNNAAVSYDATFNANNPVGASSQLALNQTFLLISTFTNVGGAGTGDASLYILSESQYANLRSVGGDIGSYLSGTAIGTGNTNIWASATQTGIASSTYTFASGNALQILNLGGTTGTIDELRYGTSFADVLPIPEPSLALLSVTGLIAGTVRRKRR